jgi:hypothetical protein
MWWEFGELIRSVLCALWITEQRMKWLCRWAVCWCEQRRQWLNELGESLWELVDAPGLLRAKQQFSQIVQTSLDVGMLTEESLCGILPQNMRISASCTKRWLKQMAECGLLASMNQNLILDGEPAICVWYSLPPCSGEMPQ